MCGRVGLKKLIENAKCARQVQSYTEFFQDDCNDAIHWLGKPNFFAAMTEGWAAYAEGELLPKRTNLYLNTGNKQVLLQKYGMIFYQVCEILAEGCFRDYQIPIFIVTCFPLS